MKELIKKVVSQSADKLTNEEINDIIDYLISFKKDNVKMCIATATDKYLVEAALKRCGLEQFFLKIFSCSEVGFG